MGNRMGLPYPKQFSLLAGIPILVHTLRAFQKVPSISHIVVVAPGEHLRQTNDLVAEYHLLVNQVVAGGPTRQDSVRLGLDALPANIDLALVHDGVRPLVTPDLITACLQVAYSEGAAITAIPVKDTLKNAVNNRIMATIDRTHLWQAQTPQAARIDFLRQAFARARQDGFIGTDEASLLEHAGIPVAIVQGAEDNIKITRPEDLQMAEALLMNKSRRQSNKLRIGHGYDAHRLTEGRQLVLGGVVIPHSRGLAGHSDADVLTHALCDALLGALGAGDIGRHFPDSDDRYKGISSLKLLEEVVRLMHRQGYRLQNCDITVIAQHPKLTPHFPAMLDNLARICETEQGCINLKATTTEKMGFAGREEGIAAHAVVLLTGMD